MASGVGFCLELPLNSVLSIPRILLARWWTMQPTHLNSLKENIYCSIRHCSKSAWIAAICFHSSVENLLLDHQQGIGFEDFLSKL